MERLVSALQAAVWLSVTERTVLGWSQRGRVRCHRLRLPEDVRPLSQLRGGWLPGPYFEMGELLSDLAAAGV